MYLCVAMKKILLLSDTHSHIDDIILKYISQADEVWHAGDIGNLQVTDKIAQLKPLRAVYGNIDDDKARVTFPLIAEFSCEGLPVFMTHIGGYPGNYKPGVLKLLKDKSPKLFICGHSHILKVQFDQELKILHMNPGAAGIHGFHQVRTMLRFQIHAGEISNLEVIEFSKKIN